MRLEETANSVAQLTHIPLDGGRQVVSPLKQLCDGDSCKLADVPVIKFPTRAEVGGVKDDGFEVGEDAVDVRLQEDRRVSKEGQEKLEDL